MLLDKDYLLYLFKFLINNVFIGPLSMHTKAGDDCDSSDIRVILCLNKYSLCLDVLTPRVLRLIFPAH